MAKLSNKIDFDVLLSGLGAVTSAYALPYINSLSNSPYLDYAELIAGAILVGYGVYEKEYLGSFLAGFGIMTLVKAGLDIAIPSLK